MVADEAAQAELSEVGEEDVVEVDQHPAAGLVVAHEDARCAERARGAELYGQGRARWPAPVP